MAGREWIQRTIISLMMLGFLSAAGAEPPPVRVGIVIDGPWYRNDEIRELFETEIRGLLEGEFDARFPEDGQVVADWTLTGIESALDRLITDPELDMVLTLGGMASNIAVAKGAQPKPVIAPFVVDALTPELPRERGGSGVRNLTYLAIPDAFARDVQAFREIVSFDRLAVLSPAAFVRAYPEHSLQKIASLVDLGVQDLVLVPVYDSAEETLSRIPPDVGAAYIAGLTALSNAEFQELIEGLNARRLPSFSLMGRMDVERGVLAGLLTESLFDRRARRVALVVQRILLGEAPESLPVAITTERRLSINMATARQIGVSPPWAVINEAELVQDVRPRVERELTLARVIREAVQVNLDLTAQRYALAAGREDVTMARSHLLPRVEASAVAAFIDEDRAAASLGQAAERTYSGGVELDQLLFGEEAWANLRIQGHLQRSRGEELETLRLDVAEDAGLAYLTVLKANTRERILKNNLQLTRENLERARVRASIGTAGPAEVYRWEAEIAQSRRELISANASRNLAEMEMNRLLHRPLEEPFTTLDTAIDDPELLLNRAPPYVYIGDRLNFRLLRDYLSALAREQSPELRRLTAAIAAQERYLRSRTLQFFTPTIGLQASVENIFERAGEGSEGIDASALPPGLLGEPADDVNWQIGLGIRLPIFTGGSRMAGHQQARQELERLRRQRDAIAEKVEQRVRSALHRSGASLAAIALSRQAADAAARTLRVVTDAYGRGAASVLDLLDAQHASLTAEEAAAIAIYEFLSDYVRVQRAIGNFDVLVSEQKNQERIEHLERYIVEHGGTLPER